MIDRVMLFGLAASVAALLFVLELVRQRRLREDYSLLWLVTAIILLVLSVSRPLLDQLAVLIGVVTYPPAALFAVAIIFLLALLLHFSTVLTKLSRENKQIAQQVAILRWELDQVRRSEAVHLASDDQDQHQGDSVER